MQGACKVWGSVTSNEVALMLSQIKMRGEGDGISDWARLPNRSSQLDFSALHNQTIKQSKTYVRAHRAFDFMCFTHNCR